MTDAERQELYELGLNGIAIVAMEALENRTEDYPPFWRPFRRARWWGRWDALISLGMAAASHERQQHAAWEESQR